MSIPWHALAGGLPIGAAAAAVLLLSGGRIAGIGGILGRLLALDAGPRRWCPAFLAGMSEPANVNVNVLGFLDVGGGPWNPSLPDD